MRLPPDIEAVVLDSLQNRPEEWTWKEDWGNVYNVDNAKLGCSVFVADRYYGLTVEFPERKFGGVTDCSTFFGPLIPWRRRIYRAAVALFGEKPRDVSRATASLRARLGLAD